MLKISLPALTVFAAAASLAVNTAALPIDLGDAEGYNGFFLEDFVSTANDSQGSLAVGGNAQLTGYTVNTLGGTQTPAIVVGGNLAQVGGDINGDAFVGGSYNPSNGAGINGTLYEQQANLSVDFVSSFNQLSQTSQALSLLGSDAAVNSGRVDYFGDGSSNQQIFNLDEAGFESAWGFFANDIDQSQEVIINVAGSIIDIDSADYLVKAADWSWIGNSPHILFNFYEATEINLSGAFHGTILATNADINAAGGSVDGQVIAKSWQGATQLNSALFQHSVPSVTATVPEPNVFWLLLAGMIGLVAARKTVSHQSKKR